MGKPKYYWYWNVKKMIQRYPQLKEENSIQSGIFVKAIEKTIEETKNLPNGEERLSAIDSIFFKRCKTIEGVAMEMNYSWRTIQNWATTFINAVGKSAGF